MFDDIYLSDFKVQIENSLINNDIKKVISEYKVEVLIKNTSIYYIYIHVHLTIISI